MNQDLLALTHTADEYDKYLNAVVPPVFMNSLHVYDSFEDYCNVDVYKDDQFVYGRSSNPTVHILERKIAELEHGSRAVAFSSGMAACTAAIMATCKAGSHIVCMRDVYQPVKRFLHTVGIPRLNFSVTYVSGNDLDEIEAALDDSNVKRYAKYLHKLTKNTQFIVITHRKGTMEAADVLYGITMQEKGVSTLVSVKLIEEQLDN